MSQAASLEPTAIAGVTRGLADTDEVVPDDVEPIHVHAVLKRLGARVRQLGGPAHLHLHREVPALSVAGRGRTWDRTSLLCDAPCHARVPTGRAWHDLPVWI